MDESTGYPGKIVLTSEPLRLVGQLQLAFILVIHLSSYGALSSYKRFLSLFTRSFDLLLNPSVYDSSPTGVSSLYVEVIQALSAQLSVIPDGSFETELPELDLFFLDEIERLRHNLIGSNPTPGLIQAWQGLQTVTKKWGWELESLEAEPIGAEIEESDEEGEYAPQVVEM